ncbi:MAG TPA: hypothetical protein VK509_20575, partial [Polyangiales bacterium]|nr:hypothetical protein [Polyangiales bacterium]
MTSIARAAADHSVSARGRAISTFCLLIASLIALLAGCGGRTPLDPGELGAPRPVAGAEQCNGLDDDRDGNVDEIFRDADGRYVVDDHCGGCGSACSRDRLPNASSQGCAVLDSMPACVAFTCAPGFGLSQSGSCVALDDRLCLACQADGDCGSLAGSTCIDVGGELRCARPCGDGCPDGYVCQPELGCVPAGNSCNCSGTSESFDVACVPRGASGECTGRARCENGALSECVSPVENCDGDDDDCDGRVDEDFVDARGAYSVDAHCGSCGVDCGLDMPVTGMGRVQLTCGGDPFAPSCVTFCPEARDGVQRGDHLDADRRIDNGCECEVRALVDTPGAPTSEGQLDANCDGADGDVLASFYVSVDGSDSGPGSPTRPLRTINVAIERAAASLASDGPRPHVFVAAGVYIESVTMRDGVRLHGGYSSDFLAQSTSNFEVIVVAPADTRAQFGAALTIDRAGRLPTLVEGIRFRGRDGIDGGAPAVGAVVIEPRNQLVLRALEISSGKPAAGAAGAEGVAGDTPLTEASPGAAPRAALESGAHECTFGNSNVTRGGAGGVSRCNAGSDVSGGPGGSANCPLSAELQPSGTNGRSGFGGLGGDGGQDVIGPILNGPSCPLAVCCGLADFRVAGELAFPQAGMPGADGSSGNAGSACSDPFGTFAPAS